MKLLSPLEIDIDKCIYSLINYCKTPQENFSAIYGIMKIQSNNFLQEHYDLLNRLLNQPDQFPDILTQIYNTFILICGLNLVNQKDLLSFCLRLMPAQMDTFKDYSAEQLQKIASVLEKVAGIWGECYETSLPVYDVVEDGSLKLRKVVENTDKFSCLNYKQLISLVLDIGPEQLITEIDFISSNMGDLTQKQLLMKLLLNPKTRDSLLFYVNYCRDNSLSLELGLSEEQRLNFFYYLSYFASNSLLDDDLVAKIIEKRDFLTQDNVVNNFKTILKHNANVCDWFNKLFIETISSKKFCDILQSETRISLLLDGWSIILNMPDLSENVTEVIDWYKLKEAEQQSLLTWMKFLGAYESLNVDLYKSLIQEKGSFIDTSSEDSLRILALSLESEYKQAITNVMLNIEDFNPASIIEELRKCLPADKISNSPQSVAAIGLFSSSDSESDEAKSTEGINNRSSNP